MHMVFDRKHVENQGLLDFNQPVTLGGESQMEQARQIKWLREQKKLGEAQGVMVGMKEECKKLEEKKESKKVQFEASITSNTEITEKSENLDQTPIKKTNSSEVEGSEVDVDDQLQSFRISPKEDIELKRVQQDQTPEKIITGGGQIDSMNQIIRQETNSGVPSVLSTMQVAANGSSMRCGSLDPNGEDQDEAGPASVIQQSLSNITSHEQLLRDSRRNSTERNRIDHTLVISSGAPPQSNIKAALASIIEQENTGASGVPLSNIAQDDGKNFELTEEQDKYLEKKILEILERNRRGEGYVQKQKQKQQQQSKTREDAASQPSGEENIHSSQQMNTNQQEQVISQIQTTGQKQRSRQKDQNNLFAGEKPQLNSFQINNTKSSKQSSSFQGDMYQHSGSSKPPVYYSMTYSQPSKNLAILPSGVNVNNDQSSIRLKAVNYTPAQSVIYELDKHERLSKVNGEKVKSQVSSFCQHPNQMSQQDRKVYKAADSSSLMMVPTLSIQNRSRELGGHAATGAHEGDEDLIILSDKEFQNMQQILNKSDGTAPDAQSQCPNFDSASSCRGSYAPVGLSQKSQNSHLNENERRLKVTKSVSVNTNCITRDAQNVYDKKRQRYEKIKRMRNETSKDSSWTEKPYDIKQRAGRSDFMLINPNSQIGDELQENNQFIKVDDNHQDNQYIKETQLQIDNNIEQNPVPAKQLKKQELIQSIQKIYKKKATALEEGYNVAESGKKPISARKRVASPKTISTRVKQRASAHASMGSHNGQISMIKGNQETQGATFKVKGYQPLDQRLRQDVRNVKTPGNKTTQGPKITKFQLKVENQTQKENLSKPNSNKLIESQANTSTMVGSSHKKRVGSAQYPKVSQQQGQPLQMIYGQVQDINCIKVTQKATQYAQPKIIEQKRTQEPKASNKQVYMQPNSGNGCYHSHESSSVGAIMQTQTQEKKKIKLLSVSATGQGHKRPQAEKQGRSQDNNKSKENINVSNPQQVQKNIVAKKPAQDKTNSFLVVNKSDISQGTYHDHQTNASHQQNPSSTKLQTYLQPPTSAQDSLSAPKKSSSTSKSKLVEPSSSYRLQITVPRQQRQTHHHTRQQTLLNEVPGVSRKPQSELPDQQKKNSEYQTLGANMKPKKLTIKSTAKVNGYLSLQPRPYEAPVTTVGSGVDSTGDGISQFWQQQMARPTIQAKNIRIVDFSRGSSIESQPKVGNSQKVSGVSKTSKESKGSGFSQDNSIGLDVEKGEFTILNEKKKEFKNELKYCENYKKELMLNNFTSIGSNQKVKKSDNRGHPSQNTIQQTQLTSRERRKQTLEYIQCRKQLILGQPQFDTSCSQLNNQGFPEQRVGLEAQASPMYCIQSFSKTRSNI